MAVILETARSFKGDVRAGSVPRKTSNGFEVVVSPDQRREMDSGMPLHAEVDDSLHLRDFDDDAMPGRVWKNTGDVSDTFLDI
jgi:hypothetical protein